LDEHEWFGDTPIKGHSVSGELHVDFEVEGLSSKSSGPWSDWEYSVRNPGVQLLRFIPLRGCSSFLCSAFDAAGNAIIGEQMAKLW